MADCIRLKNQPKLPGSSSFPNLRMIFKGVEIHGKLCTTSKESPRYFWYSVFIIQYNFIGPSMLK